MICFTPPVVVYGIASSLSHDIDDFYPTMEEAQAALAQIVSDEPELEAVLWVARVDLDSSPN